MEIQGIWEKLWVYPKNNDENIIYLPLVGYSLTTVGLFLIIDKSFVHDQLEVA